MSEELRARLATVNRRFSRALDLGAADGALGTRLPVEGVVSADAGFRFASGIGGVQCDEDRLPFADSSFDLVVSRTEAHTSDLQSLMRSSYAVFCLKKNREANSNIQGNNAYQ